MNHEIGDTKTVGALDSTEDGSRSVHELELYDPPGSNSEALSWKCEHCQKYFSDWKVYENEPCVSWGPEQ